MGLLDQVREERDSERAFPIDTWISDYLIPATSFAFGGQIYQAGPGGVIQTQAGQRIQEITTTLPGYMAALRKSPPAFAAQMVRALALSQARFIFRNLPSSPTPRRTFGTQALSVLEVPWRNATTGELLSKMEWMAGLTGNAFVLRQPDRLRILRSDWVGILFGSQQDPDDAAFALDGEVVAYVYQQGGIRSDNSKKLITLLPDEVVHWAPVPDPEAAEIGMSWITPAIREIQGDQAATEHKLQFFKNGATPNMVVKGIPAANLEQFNKVVDDLEAKHSGVRNAYKTLYLGTGADVSVVGSNLQQLDFKATQGAGETRIAYLSRVPAPILNIAEGLAGSSLNAGNFAMARRNWADTWIYPTLQDLARALGPLVRVPSDAELWYDIADMPVLREDAKDAAEIEQVKAATIVALVNGGFKPDTVLAAVAGQNISLLQHTGYVSVQLQLPGQPLGQPAGGAPVAVPGQNGRPQNGRPPPPRGRSEPVREEDDGLITVEDLIQGFEEINRADTSIPEGKVGDYKARHLIRWFNEGAGGRIPWGSPGDWAACVAVAAPHLRDPKGFCAERHHDVLGIWPATHAKELKGK